MKSIVKKFEDAQDRLVIQASDLSLEAISGMVATNAIDIRPEFQRRERWTPRQASALIESFLLNIPVPPVYLAEEDFGRYAVIDGKQRIGAIRDFMSNSLALAGLTRFESIDGLRFEELPDALKNSLRVRPYLRVVTLLRQSDPDVKYEVFHRLNSGGEPLNAQEIRNVVYRGSLNDAVMNLSANEFLRNRLKIRDTKSPAYRSMQDVEYVLRFLALRSNWKSFGGDFRIEMDEFMASHQSAPSGQIKDLSDSFSRAILTCQQVWGRYAFQRFDGRQWRDQMLGGMYDAQMIAVDSFDHESQKLFAAHSAKVLEETMTLFSTEGFDAAVRTATNTPSRLRFRVERMIDVLQGVAEAKG